MRRISVPRSRMEGRISRGSSVGKKVLIWGLVGVGLVAVGFSIAMQRFDPGVLAPFAAALLVWQYRKTFAGIVDDVYDDGEALWVSKASQLKGVGFSEIEHVDYGRRNLVGTGQSYLPVIRVRFKKSTAVGKEITFIPETKSAPFSAKDEDRAGEDLARELRERAAKK